MPTYEYQCRGCDGGLEVQQSFTDAPLTECPSCGGALRKKFSAVGISFKGSGFYKTDSRSSSSTSSSSKESSSATATASSAADASKPASESSTAKAAPADTSGAKAATA